MPPVRPRCSSVLGCWTSSSRERKISVTLISAPAGSGKTVLLRAWMAATATARRDRARCACS